MQSHFHPIIYNHSDDCFLLFHCMNLKKNIFSCIMFLLDILQQLYNFEYQVCKFEI